MKRNIPVEESSSLKIGYIFLHPPEGSLGTAAVLLRTTKALADLGVESHIFTPFGKFRQLAPRVYIHKLPTSWYYAKFFYEIARKLYYSPFVAKRFINIDTLMKVTNRICRGLMKYIQKRGIELDLIEGEQEIGAIVAIRASAQLKVPVVAHLHNLWAEELVDMGVITKDSSNYQQLKQLVRQIVEEADLTLTATHYMKQYLVDNYEVSLSKLVPAPKGASPVADISRKSYESIKIVYSGALSKHENVELYIKAIALVSKCLESLEFYITGKGPYKRQLCKLARKLKAPVRFLWLPTENEYYNFLSKMHIGIIPWENKVSRRIGASMKFLDYISAGIAVIATDIGGWTEIIKRERVGLLTEPSPESMAEEIIRLIKNIPLLREYGTNAYTLAQRYTWSEASRALLNKYLQLLNH